MTHVTSTRGHDRPLTLLEGLDDPTNAIMDREFLEQDCDPDRDYYAEARARAQRLVHAKRQRTRLLPGGTHA
jgi:hypothetical protein